MFYLSYIISIILSKHTCSPGTVAFETGQRFCIDGAALVFYPEDGSDSLSGDIPKAQKLTLSLELPDSGTKSSTVFFCVCLLVQGDMMQIGTKRVLHWQHSPQSSLARYMSASSMHGTKQALEAKGTAEVTKPEKFGLQGLYPPSVAYTNGTLAVDHGHTLYYEVHGCSDGDAQVLNALFLHGGPGAGCTTNHARFFDPTLYRIVLWDQRGSGRSTPRGSVQANTLRNTVEDAECLRQHFHIKKWDVILGGSWGATVAVAYAQEYPACVSSVVLRGVCLLRPCEVNWLFGNTSKSLAQLYPAAWQTFCQAVQVTPPSTGNEALHAYYDRLLGDNNKLRLTAAQTWMQWEMSAMMSGQRKKNNNMEEALRRAADMLVAVRSDQWMWQNAIGSPLLTGPNVDPEATVQRLCQGLVDHAEDYKPLQYMVRPLRPVVTSLPSSGTDPWDTPDEDFVPAQNMLTCFYSVNNLYTMNNVRLLDTVRMSRIANIPCIGVHGGNDCICPVDTALALKAQWPAMELRIPIGASHSMYDAAIANQLVRATDQLAAQLLQQQK
jgi:proline iminopeptidase